MTGAGINDRITGAAVLAEVDRVRSKKGASVTISFMPFRSMSKSRYVGVLAAVEPQRRGSADLARLEGVRVISYSSMESDRYTWRSNWGVAGKLYFSSLRQPSMTEASHTLY